MRYRFFILVVTLFFAGKLNGQEKYKVSWIYKGLSFDEFVAKAESVLPVKFYYKNDWVTDLKLSDYPDCETLPCILDNLFMVRQIHYYIDDFGNVVVTGNFVVDEMNERIETGTRDALPIDRIDTKGSSLKNDPIKLVIGNPADRNRSGKVVISG